MVKELDLLRRTGFANAQYATVSLRIFDKQRAIPPGLQLSDFTLIVNGTHRDARLHTPASGATVVPPVVLLVFPPNEPVIHHIAIHQATAYFSKQPDELLPWKVGIFDSNGKLTPFTNGRSQLLAYLDVVDHTVEPFQYSTDVNLPTRLRWDSPWLARAEEAIAIMQRYEGPKVILAMNPLGESIYGRNDQLLAHDGPESLTPAAEHIGAHIYIANVGGPDALVPLGDAASQQAAQINTPNGPTLGTRPSYHMQVDPADNAALSYFAYRTSQMMQAAASTLGGFANSLNDLAAQIHHDLDGNYALDFDLTPADRDRGIPSVEVRLDRRDLKLAILDVVPIGSLSPLDRQLTSKQLTDLLARAAKHPVSSPDLRITQHVDYFPLHAGLEPMLPMSAGVEWTGPGKPPAQLSFVESVEDEALATTILQRDVTARWEDRNLAWERDGQLRPGAYLWRIVVHDGNGKILASSEDKIDVAFPHQTPVAVSSLILGKSCRHETDNGLQKRPAASSDVDPVLHLTIDPMRAANCRLAPTPTDRFASTDVLHAFVRIYPTLKLEKRTPESWTATFLLYSKSGLLEAQKEMPFTVDSGSGYLASIRMPLNAAGITPGPHTLDVKMHGPGIHSDRRESRQISIVAPDNP